MSGRRVYRLPFILAFTFRRATLRGNRLSGQKEAISFICVDSQDASDRKKWARSFGSL